MRQLVRARRPRSRQVAKVIEETLDFGGADLRNKVESDPITRVGHDGKSIPQNAKEKKPDRFRNRSGFGC